MGASLRGRTAKVVSLAAVAHLSLSFSSAAIIRFEKSYGGSNADQGYQARQTRDGGYIAVGETNSFGMGLTDVYLVKTDSLGATEWTATYGGDSWDHGTSVRQTQDGGYALTGYTWSPGLAEYDIYLVKTDTDGNMEWSRTFGGNGCDYGWSVLQASDGGYIIVGSTASLGLYADDVYMVRTDPLGNLVWSETYGGTDQDVGRCVKQTDDGGYIIAGRTELFASYPDFYLIKTDSLGSPMWSSAYGGEFSDEAHSVDVTEDGGYVIAGWTVSSSSWGDADFFVIKTDSLGNTIWTRTRGGQSHECLYSVDATRDGGCVVVGTILFSSTSDNIYLAKMTSSGDIVWESHLGGLESESGYSIGQTTDGGFIISGGTNSFGSGSSDLLLIKTDELGVAPEYDVSVVSIDEPGEVVQPDSTYALVATVRSHGNVESSFRVTAYVDDYSDTISVRRLPPGSKKQIEFRPWRVPNVGFTTYDIHLCVHIENDQNPDNDCLWKRVAAVDTLGPVVVSAMASDNINQLPGIDEDDYVLLTFNEKTNSPALDHSNIDAVLSLSSGHSWLDGQGELGRAEWNFIGDMLLITLSTGVSPPTVAVGDTLALDGVTIKDIHYRSSPCWAVIQGSFDPVGVAESHSPAYARRTILMQNWPNPFSSRTVIRYQIGSSGLKTRMPVQLSIQDASGRMIATLVDQVQNPGQYEICWEAERCPAGVYFCTLKAGHTVDLKKMTLVR
jgi:hypothetical protein